MIPPRCTVNNNLNASGPVDLADAVDIRSKDNLHTGAIPCPVPRRSGTCSPATRRDAAACDAAKVSPVVAQLLLNRESHRPSRGAPVPRRPLAGLHPPLALPGSPRRPSGSRGRRREAEDLRLRRLRRGRRHRHRHPAPRCSNDSGPTSSSTRPLRLAEGYGLNCEKLRELARAGVSLVVTVDCGIASIAEAEVAREVGLELIVTDHHEMKVGLDGPLLPAAAVLVHPRLPGAAYPFGDLSGAGVAFKLAWAVAQRASGSEKVAPGAARVPARRGRPGRAGAGRRRGAAPRREPHPRPARAGAHPHEPVDRAAGAARSGGVKPDERR